MYYRVAIRVDSLSTWQWKSTVLSELSTLFLFLRRYGPLQLERLRVFSSPSREGLEEQLVQQNEGLLSPSVTAAQFLHERLIQTPGMKQATPVCVGGASQQMASIPIVAESSINESIRQGIDLVGRSHSALESRRLALEIGPGGDHDVPYHFVMPASLLPVLPVCEGEQVFVWFSGFGDQAAYDQHVAALARSQEWQDQIWEPLLGCLKAAPSVLKLAPTARSLVHG